MNKAFIIGNLPPAHRVYFAVGSDSEHFILKPLMDKYGESYFERSYVHDKKWLVRVLIGSTDKKEIIDLIVNNYFFEYSTYGFFPFLIAEREIPGWDQQLPSFLMGVGRLQPR